MSRILLVDDSPHAQRMGERILVDEGYEVVTVSNADSALIRLDDVDPDVVLADTVMPGRTGFDICHYLKMSPRHRHVRVLLTAGVLEPLDEEQAKRAEADGTLKKPFEATALLAAVKPLAEAATAARARSGSSQAGAGAGVAGSAKTPMAPFIAVVDNEQVRAAVTVALDASMGVIVDEITRRVVAALATKKNEPLESAVPASLSAPAKSEDSGSRAPAASAPLADPVRRVSPVRLRSTSILGLSLGRGESPDPPPSPPSRDRS